jgi:hypothetical protein
VSGNWSAGRYDGDTADIVAELPVDSLFLSFREVDDKPTVTLGLTYEQADRLASLLIGEIPADWKADTYPEHEDTTTDQEGDDA